MFEPGEYIHHATSGLCRVEEVTRLNVSGADRNRQYYRLTPLEGHGSVVYTPVDNQKVAMRRIMTREEAGSLIDSMPGIETIWIQEEKVREHAYKEALHSVDCRRWVQIIKTLYVRRQDRLASGRKVTSTDEKYLKSAQDRLYGELALALDIPREGMEEYISARLT